MAEKKLRSLEDNAILLVVGAYVAESNFSAAVEALNTLYPADIADVLQNLSHDDALEIIKLLPVETQSEVIPELGESWQQMLGEELNGQELRPIIVEMDSDDAADFIGLMDKPSQQELLEHVDKVDAEDVRELLSHAEDTAGGLMSKEFVAVRHNASVEEAIGEIRHAVEETEQIYTVFVIDEKTGVLKGSLPLGTLVLAKPYTKVSEIMVETHSVTTTLDQEQVAKYAKKYDLVEIPVVNEQNILVGRITHDDILDVFEEEAEEDFRRLSGTGNEDIMEKSVWEISKQRITWVIIGLLGGCCSAYIMSNFDVALGQILVLAFFVPVITAMGGNVGIQSSTVTVRGLATGEIIPQKVIKRVFRELSVNLVNGAICSALLGGFVLAWQQNLAMGAIVSLSLITVMLVATLSGTIIPLVLFRFKIDPAIATGPFVTTFNDIIGLSVYFLLTSFFLKLM